MATKLSGSSRREKRIAASEIFTKPLTSKQRRELQALARKPDSAIDYSDAPALGKRRAAVTVGKFYRPVKKLLRMRIDADVLEWFRSQGGGYQTRINMVLRREMDSRERR